MKIKTEKTEKEIAQEAYEMAVRELYAAELALKDAQEKYVQARDVLNRNIVGQ